MKWKPVRFLIHAGLIYLMTGLAQASPIFSIGEGGDKSWTAALNDGDIQVAVNPLSGNSAQQFYNSQIGMMGVTDIVAAGDTQLTPVNPVSDGTESHDSLVMSWDLSSSFAPSDLVVSAWDYVYDVDPDLTNTMVHFSARAPTGVWDLSMELFDSAGRSRGWFAGLPAASWTNYWIDPNNTSPQGPFGAFFDTPGFDITQVVFIRLNESSMGGPPSFFDVDPSNPSLPLPGNAWNAWNHLAVTAVPLPSALWLFAGGLLGLAGVHKRSSRH